jgi:hypothetical protein
MLLYQFGRKDPIPARSSLYNYSSTISNYGEGWQRWNDKAWARASQVPVSESVNFPMWIYGSTDSWRSWARDVRGITNVGTESDPVFEVGYIWHDSKLQAGGVAPESIRSYEGKSIFDPCPAGWKIPTIAAWEDFRRDDTTGNTISAMSNRPNNNGPEYRDFPAVNFTQFYWPNIEIDGSYPVNGFIQYPLIAYRSSNGTLYRDNALNNKLWQAVPFTTNITTSNDDGISPLVFHLKNDGTILPDTSFGGKDAIGVRCISMED